MVLTGVLKIRYMQMPVIATGYVKTLHVSSLAGVIRFAGNCFGKKIGGKINKNNYTLCMDTFFL